MTGPWRPLALAAALHVVAGVGVAAAQTVIVTNAPPGSTVELVLNAATIGSATADRTGNATLAVNLGKAETDAHISVDVCKDLRRVLLMEQGQQPPPAGGGCDRREIAGLFLVRRVTTLVVSLAGPSPTLWLRQGPAPAEWLIQQEESERVRPARTWRPSPTGLVLFGGGGLVKIGQAVAVACGDLEQCAGNDVKGVYAAGAAYWINRYVAAEASYVKPATVTMNGGADTFRFNSAFEAHILTVTGKVGVPIGPVRVYGQVGMNYHRALFTTTQTNDDVTVTIDDVEQTIKGGTQTFELRTGGWGWVFGGGAEAWVTRRLAIYAEAGRARLKGSTLDDGEGGIDDRATFVLVGARVHIGR